MIDIIKGQIKDKIKIKILVEDGEVSDFFSKYTYSDKTTGLEKFRLGYVIYDEKYVSFWIEDIEIEDEAKYEKRKLIIKLDKEAVDKYNEMNYRFNEKSVHFNNLVDFEKWLES